MEKSLKSLNAAEGELEVILTENEIKPYYEDAYRQARNTITVQGFRKGKVPMNIIKSRFGKSIEEDTNEKIVNDTFQKIVKEDDLRIIGHPHLHNVERTIDGLKFIIHFEQIPDFQLADFRGLVIDEPVHAVSDDEIDSQIENFKLRRAKFEAAEQIFSEDYVVSIQLHKIDPETGMAAEDQKAETLHVYMNDKTVNTDLKNSLLNLKLNDTLMYNGEIKSKVSSGNFLITIMNIQKVIPGELDSEYISELTGGRLTEFDELKEEIGFNLQEQWDSKSREAMERQVIDKLIDMHPNLKAPHSMIHNVEQSMIEDLAAKYKIDPKTLKGNEFDSVHDAMHEMAERTVKWELIKNKIIESEQLKIEEFDLEPIVEQESQRLNVDKELIKKQLLQNDQFINSILVKKTMDLILDFAITNETLFSADDESFEGLDEEFEEEEEFEDEDEVEEDDEEFEDEDDDFDEDDYYDDEEEDDEEDDEEDEEVEEEK